MSRIGRSVFFVALLVGAPLALASVATGALTGRVRIGTKLSAGVNVTASSAALQKPRTTVSTRRGRYWLGALPPGVYDVTFSLPGHTSVTKRAVVELAKVARTDASIEPSEDEESVTSTAATPGIADTIPITSHFDDRSLDRLPTGRIDTASLAPGLPFGQSTSVDGVPGGGSLASEETIAQLTVIRGAAPVEWETFAGTETALLTKSGGEDLFFTLRDTISSVRWNDTPGLPAGDDGTNHFGEATIGGRIVAERFWFFAAAWSGDRAYPWPAESQGVLAKADGQFGESHLVTASYAGDDAGSGFTRYENDTAAARYSGNLSPRLTSEILASRSETQVGEFYETSLDFVSGRASYDRGGHILTGGFSARDDRSGALSRSWFAGDRWSSTRWNIQAGIRYDDGRSSDRFTPRVAVTWDVRANGRSAIAASYGEYASPVFPASSLRIATLGYASAIGRGGSARADVFHRSEGSFWMHELQVDARYRLFDRLEAGGTYTLRNQSTSGSAQPAYPEQDLNAWIGVELPLGAHEIGVTVLQHYREFFSAGLAPTDVALRYMIPQTHFRVLLAIDATNVFLDGEGGLVPPRAVRGWVRLTL